MAVISNTAVQSVCLAIQTNSTLSCTALQRL